MTAVALRCAALLRRTSLVLGILLVAIITIPYSLDPLRFPWHMVGENMPMQLWVFPGIGLVMAVLGIVPAPLLLTRTIAVLLGGVGVLVALGTTPGAEAGLGGGLPVALLTGALVFFGAAGVVRRVAPWSSLPRALAAVGVVAALVLYLVPGIVGDGMAVSGLFSALGAASGEALIFPIAALVPLLLAAISLSTLLPPTAVGPSWARLIGGVAVLLPAALATAFLLRSGAGSVGLAAIVSIVLLCGFVWPALGLGVLLFGLFSGDEPEEATAVADDFDPSKYFGEGTQQMEAWEPEPSEEDGEATRIVQSPAEILQRSARATQDRPQPSSVRYPPQARPAPAPRQAPVPRPAQTALRPQPRYPEPEAPDSSDRTVMLDKPLGKKRK